MSGSGSEDSRGTHWVLMYADARPRPYLVEAQSQPHPLLMPTGVSNYCYHPRIDCLLSKHLTSAIYTHNMLLPENCVKVEIVTIFELTFKHGTGRKGRRSIPQ